MKTRPAPQTRGGRALMASMKAQQYGRAAESSGNIRHGMLAAASEQEAEALMQPGEIVRISGEAIPADTDSIGLLDTLEDPSSVGLDASHDRLTLLCDAGVLELGVDTALAIGAQNGIERMLAHQMAAAHRNAMKFAARAQDDATPPVEAVRAGNSMARAMEAFQGALLTLQKLRTGGNQRIIVQHVNVNDGGQAVIAAGDVEPCKTREGTEK